MLGGFEEQLGHQYDRRGGNKADSYRRLKDLEQKSDKISPGLPCSGSHQLLPTSKPVASGMSLRADRINCELHTRQTKTLPHPVEAPACLVLNYKYAHLGICTLDLPRPQQPSVGAARLWWPTAWVPHIAASQLQIHFGCHLK